MRIDPSFRNDGSSAESVSSSQTASRAASSYTSAGAGPQVASAGGEDTLRLSGTMTEVQQLSAQLAQTPDIRAARVAALQQQIGQGSYQPSGQQVAAAMLDDFAGTAG